MKLFKYFLILSSIVLLTFVSCQQDEFDDIDNVDAPIENVDPLSMIPDQIPDESLDHMLLEKRVLTIDSVCIGIAKFAINTGQNYVYKPGEEIFNILLVMNMSDVSAHDVTVVESTYLSEYQVEGLRRVNLDVNPNSTHSSYDGGFVDIPEIGPFGYAIVPLVFIAPEINSSHSILYSMSTFLNSVEFEKGRVDGQACINNSRRNSVAVNL